VIYNISKKNEKGEFQRETGHPLCMFKYIETPSTAPVDIREAIKR
jgi:hypothetical protein